MTKRRFRPRGYVSAYLRKPLRSEQEFMAERAAAFGHEARARRGIGVTEMTCHAPPENDNVLTADKSSFERASV